jgi:ubiquinone/menaquinone biosynthesis C-methylase UbiE
MQRVNTPELLDSDDCPSLDVAISLKDLGRINRWFGGVATSKALLERVLSNTGAKRLSLLEVAAGLGAGPRLIEQRLACQGVTIDVTLLDRAVSHLPHGSGAVSADALALPFRDSAFDVVGCNLFAHHLDPPQLRQFVREALRVSRYAVLVNDLVRHPLHLALVYAAFPLMRTRVSRLDGVASVRRAYVPDEVREILSPMLASGEASELEIFRHYLFRMGVIVWGPRRC